MKCNEKIPRSIIIWAKASDVCAISYIDQNKTLFGIFYPCISVALHQDLSKYLKAWIAPGLPYSPQGLTEIFPKVWLGKKYKKQTHIKRDVKALN